MLKKIFFINIVIFLNIICLNKMDISVDKNIREQEINNYFEPKDSEKASKKNQYIGVLEIKSINLKQGLVDYHSKYNNIKYNIQIIESSLMPNVKNGNLILAAHRGNSKVSFFNNLYKLKKGDIITIYYQNNIYNYEYSNKYDVIKNGKVQIKRDKTKTTLTLITCKKGTNYQTVFVSYLL